jgi:hypothetical protein
MKEIIELTKKFEKFTTIEISSAVKELNSITKESNRKHLQRLVYTNLVNRFDVLVDNLLLIYSTKGDDFKDTVLNKVKDTNITAKDFYEILSAEEPKNIVKEKIEDLVRLNFLRERHSKKLRTLLHVCLKIESSDLDRPRVNANDGRIHDKYTLRHKQIPSSIIGYADYLYAKRNVLVHSDGTSLAILPSDALYLKKNFNVTPVKFVGIKLSSIESAITFYSYICRFIETGKWPEKRGF